ncbi:hypothetical protein LTR84_000563 [Exophiala bonariae]|uniref:DNA (cytosine-5-)-methyltransferase n=1 Tax=Exophiala bonariae TaxID=1690606 RepID=A0AAV9NSP7_9EURO|nr:hypothetical protein LTR84_000563 [Exophiala bonariae]
MEKFVVRLPPSRNNTRGTNSSQNDPSRTIDPQQINLRPGWSVQLKDGSYLHIRSWKTDRLNRIIFKGYKLVYPNTDDHCVEFENKELLWVSYAHPKDQQVIEFERSEDDVVRNCRIIFTNQPYHNMNYEQDAGSSLEPLYFCRWKRVLPLASEMYRRRKEGTRHLRGSVEHLKPSDSMCGHRLQKSGALVPIRIGDKEVREIWRGVGVTALGGSHQEHIFDDITMKQYTIADCCCGAGGASQGALDAGLKIKWAFDMDRDAMATYTKRFFNRCGTECRLENCADFLRHVMRDPRPYLVDIMHVSPPCQPFSPANTTPNAEKNAANLATFTTVEDLIRLTRPRIATVEESDGLEKEKHRDWFIKLISMFTGLGYSVRWAVLKLSEYGVPQTRTRLIMIAAGPGEQLPSLPMPTHGNGSHLHPLPSIRDAISNIPFGLPDHNVNSAHSIAKNPFNPETLSGTIKCSGNSEKVYHPDGQRLYTTCEMKLIQTFPLDFKFIGGKTSQSRQIGNAVPPLAAKAWFTEIKESLATADEREVASNGNI